MPGNFFDSNVLLYTASADQAKVDRAKTILAIGGSISVQVLNEISSVARRKMRMSWPETREYLDTMQRLVDVVPLTTATHDKCLDVAQRYGVSIYDGMIIAAAMLCGSDILWSEDMHDGLLIDGSLTITNPFR